MVKRVFVAGGNKDDKVKRTRKPLRGELLRYLGHRVGQQVFLKDIMADLNETQQRVQSGMVHIRTSAGHKLEVVSPGHAWVYKGYTSLDAVGLAAVEPEAKADNGKRLFEEIGPAKDGSLIIQDADTGSLFKAVEL